MAMKFTFHLLKNSNYTNLHSQNYNINIWKEYKLQTKIATFFNFSLIK